ncbi:MAG TPA: hypothetical protein VHM20_05835 [Gammaproteobacteria bacterium]|jgi:hypothetical protein|nr:hypothetical protein [Gammaproteobacteria bacterium]
MSDLARCESCEGRKTILGLGGIRRNCQVCNGVGWVKKSIEKEPDVIVEAKPVRRGRPKKEVGDG